MTYTSEDFWFKVLTNSIKEELNHLLFLEGIYQIMHITKNTVYINVRGVNKYDEVHFNKLSELPSKLIQYFGQVILKFSYITEVEEAVYELKNAGLIS